MVGVHLLHFCYCPVGERPVFWDKACGEGWLLSHTTGQYYQTQALHCCSNIPHKRCSTTGRIGLSFFFFFNYHLNIKHHDSKITSGELQLSNDAQYWRVVVVESCAFHNNLKCRNKVRHLAVH